MGKRVFFAHREADMGNIRMSIDFEDKELSKALAKAVMLCGGFDVNVGHVRDTDHVLLSSAGSIAPAGIVYVEAGEFCEDRLTEEPYVVDIFSGADRVVSRIKFILGTDMKANVSSRVRTIMFCSDKGGSGCTVLACGSGIMLHRFEGRKTAFLSLSPRNGEARDFLRCCEGEEKNWSRMVYCMDAGRSPEAELLMNCDEDMSYFGIPLLNVNVHYFTAEHLRAVCTWLSGFGYDDLIIDQGAAFSPTTDDVKKACDVVVSVNSANTGDFDSRFVFVHNRVPSDEGNFLPPPEDTVVIPIVSDAGRAGLDGEFGSELLKLTEALRYHDVR